VAGAEAGVRPARSLAGVGAVVLATLVALVVGSFQGHEQPTPRPTPLAPSTTADPRQSRPLAGLPLAGPSPLPGGTHIAAVHPNGRDIAVGFHGLAAPGEEGYDLWLLHTASRRWQHLPDLPAADVAAKATDLAWTRDGRLVGAGPGTGQRGAMAPVKALQRHHHGPASRMASKPGEG
jgi:hypothetical protein